MIIKETLAKSIITKSNLPESDFVINPYIGCSHACIYCYARFMKRFSGHEEEWGRFVDVKVNAADLIPKNLDKYKNKSIVIGSVTDPYQPAEKKYKITRDILKKIVDIDAKIQIITKSDLIIRDIDLLRRFKKLTVAFSVSRSDDKNTKLFEPGASDINSRIVALKELYKNNIRTVVFISPIFPIISDWKNIIKKTKKYTDEYWFENLNIYPSVKEKIYSLLKNNFSELMIEYKKIYDNEKKYWDGVEKDIVRFCKKDDIDYKIYFHHKYIKK